MLRRETCKWLDERALGIAAEMDGGLSVSESPLCPPKGGIHPSAVAGICRTLRGKPDGAAANNSDDGVGDGFT